MWSRILKVIAALYIPLLIFSLVWSYWAKQNLIDNLVVIQQKDIGKKNYQILDQCEVLIDITSYWANVSIPVGSLDGNKVDTKFIEEYIRIMQGYDPYDQLRFLDLHGNEILRYERIDKYTLKPKPLQRKVDRDYFQKGLSLKKGQIYISSIDLNREYGILELPHKPVIRGVTPIFDTNQEQVGLAVINFNMTKVFNLINTRLSEDNFYLIDGQKNVLTTNASKSILPHQAKMSKVDSMIRKKIELKSLIFKTDTVFVENGSLWLYKNVNIGFEKDVGMNRYEQASNIVTDNDWAIIQEVPESYIDARQSVVNKNLVLINILTAIVAFFVAWYYVQLQKERSMFVSELEEKNNALAKGKVQLEATNLLLKKVNNKLWLRNQQLEEFNYVVAHNLKSPVSSMSIVVDLLSKSKDQKSFDEFFPKLRSISESIKTLTEDVHTYVSILSNKKLKIENVNLLLLLKDVENDFVETLLDREASNFKTIYKLDAWHSLKCSKFYMKSIFQNLLSNAIKYRKPNAESHFIVETVWENNQKVLYIRDNGLGINMDRHRDSMFKLYKRFHRNVSGKGMGLFIVKSQLEAMNATIEIESEEGVGTTFKIKFS
ncbi:sensor histidine kinase [Muricauda ruestringensis]|uniref:sensor histidine kinase n=1 Tax=Flagellimonas ruestringensis TaxID=111501 RepID=UPI001CD760ED|nr:sensor histidine kinase [Allomuricauda ruestringensis]MCA0959207.1 sensor histidine kinase [Allomuricauda ruestringensis]